MRKQKCRTDKRQLFLACVYAVAGAIGFSCALKYCHGVVGGSLFQADFIMIIFIIPLLYLNLYVSPIRVSSIPVLVFSLLLAAIIIIGAQLDFTSEISWQLETPISIIALSFFIFPITKLIIHWISKYLYGGTPLKLSNRAKVIIFIAILVSNIVVWLSLFPGIYSNDSANQVKQFIDGAVTTHYSVSFSAVLFVFLKIGNFLFNSYSIGFAFYILCQIIFLTYVASQIIFHMVKYTSNKLFVLFGVGFYVLNILIHAVIVWSCQDATFGGVFALLFLNLLEFCQSPESFLSKRSNLIKLSILILVLCMTRNNGFYIIAFTTIIILTIAKDSRRQVALFLMTPLLLFQLYFNVALPLLGVSVDHDDALKEMSSIPSQQLARAYTSNRSLLSPEQIRLLHYFYTDPDDFSYYNTDPSIADNRKRFLNVSAVKENPFGYTNLWISIGIRSSREYTEAALLTNLGYWYPNKIYYDSRMFHSLVPSTNVAEDIAIAKGSIPILQRPALSSGSDIVQYLLDKESNGWQKIPILRTLITPGFCFILFLFLNLLIILRKNYQLFIPISLIIGLYITLLLSPVAMFRYVFPIALLVPLLVALLFMPEKK